MYDLIVIGLGPAGINACIYAKRSNLNILVIERGMPGGTLHSIKDVQNYLGYKQINGSDLAMEFYRQFKELNIPMQKDEVINIKHTDEYQEVITKTTSYKTKSIIISTGRGPKKLGLENENIKGISYCTLCDGALYKDKEVALYSSNPRGLEDAVYLAGLVKKLYMITNKEKLLGSEQIIKDLSANPNVEIITNSVINKINGTEQINSIEINDRVINLDGLFINNEYGPVTYFVEELGITNEKGYIVVNHKQETSVPGIFACGDATQKDIYQIITAASEGATAATNAFKYIKNI